MLVGRDLLLRNCSTSQQYVQDGTSDWLRQELTRQLETIQKALPFARMPAEIFVEFDWRENVLKNYRGDYFLRLR